MSLGNFGSGNEKQSGEKAEAMTSNFMDSEVRVFCPVCQEGKNAIWHGTLIDWGIELASHIDNKPPAWYLYACRHQNHHGHHIMVKYPDKTVPLDLKGFGES